MPDSEDRRDDEIVGRRLELERLGRLRSLNSAQRAELEELRCRELDERETRRGEQLEARIHDLFEAALEPSRREKEEAHCQEIRRAVRKSKLEQLERSHGLDSAGQAELDELRATYQAEAEEIRTRVDAIREAHGYPPVHDGTVHTSSAHGEAAPGRDSSRKPGQKLRALREECGWTVEGLAAEIGLDKSNVQDHLTGRTKPRASTLRAYSDAFTKALKRTVAISDCED